MQFSNLAILASVAAIRAAAETTIDANDVPQACVNICRSTIDLSNRCEIQADNDTSNTDDDIVYNDCFCKEPSAQARIEECATCVKANGMTNTDDDNDVAELMRDCGWDFAAANTTPANSAPTPTGTGSTGQPSVTLAPTTISTGGTTVVVSTPTVVGNTQLPSTSVPAAGAMATPAVALVAAGLAAVLL